MGELSKPFMTPVGVLYRSFHDTEGHAFKSAEWAVKLFGGKATPFNIIGPGKKGFYEAAILFTVPEKVECVKTRKDVDESWRKEPARAYVFYDSYETPAALYFFQHEYLLKPGRTPPFTAYFTMSLDQ